MKKILSMIAAAMVCAVMLVSCGESSGYKSEMIALQEAMAKQDWNTALTNAKVILNGQDKATANDLLTAGISAYQSLAGIGQQGGQAPAPADLLDISQKIASALEKAKSMDASFYAEQNDQIKAKTGSSIDDFVASVKTQWIPAYEAMVNGGGAQQEAKEEGAAEETEAEEE